METLRNGGMRLFLIEVPALIPAPVNIFANLEVEVAIGVKVP